MSRRILALIAVLAVALAVLVGLAVRRGVLRPAETVAIGGPFQLVDQTGRSVDQTVLKGKWSVVFFGYTHCPDICPTTLFELGQAEPLLGAAASDFQALFITVDPVRDTVAQMKAYASNPAFPKRLLALTGTPAQVEVAAKAYRSPYSRSAETGDYLVSHTAFAYLMGPRGRFVCVLPYELSPDETAQKIRAAMAKGPGADSC